MKSIKVIVFCIIVIFSLQLTYVSARSKIKPYNKKIFTTIKGEVVKSEYSYNRIMKEIGLHIYLKSSDGKYLVHVCPKWYAVKNKISYVKGESIVVSGSKFIKHVEKNIYASKIVSGSSKVLKFRNPKTSSPLWHGRYRGELLKINNFTQPYRFLLQRQ